MIAKQNMLIRQQLWNSFSQIPPTDIIRSTKCNGFFCLLKEKPVKEHRRFAATQIFLNGYKYFSRKGQSDSLGNELYKFRNSKKRFFFFHFLLYFTVYSLWISIGLDFEKKNGVIASTDS